MSDDRSLEPDVAALLSRVAKRVEAPADASARVMERLATTLPELRGGGGGGATAATATKLVPIVLAFVVGGGVGGAITRATMAPTERVVTVERAPVTSVAAPAAPPAATPTISSMPVESLPSVTIAAPPAPSADAFVAERRVLDTARTALARGDGAEALRALREHETTYPRGALVEEREALFVRTFADSGRLDDAHARAEAFRSRWPRSLFLPVVEAAIAPP